MRNDILKRLLVVCFTVILLITMPGVVVLADVMGENISVTDNNSGRITIIDESNEVAIEEKEFIVDVEGDGAKLNKEAEILEKEDSPADSDLSISSKKESEERLSEAIFDDSETCEYSNQTYEEDMSALEGVSIEESFEVSEEPIPEQPVGASSIAYAWPLDASIPITSEFGQWSGHTGCDMACSVGHDVYATAAGTVVTVRDQGCNGSHRSKKSTGTPSCTNPGCTGSYGNWIYINHGNNVYSAYCHLLSGSILVSEGQYVEQGQMIAQTGVAGNVSGPHLHFEIRVGRNSSNSAVNPRNYLTRKNIVPEYPYTILTDYGDDFYAYIIADGNGHWRHVSNIDSNVQIPEWNDSNDPRQIWHFYRQSDNSYKIYNEYDGSLLDADWNNTSNGENVQSWRGESGDDNQRWYIARTSNGAVTLVSKYTDMSLDCTGGSISSGTNIQMYEINNTAAQSFSIYNLTNDGNYYAKPEQPDKIYPNEPKGCLQGVPITLSWPEAGLKSGSLDNRTYDVRIYKDGKVCKSAFGLTGTSLDVTLDEPGDYSYSVATVNTKYYEWYRISDERGFKVYEVKKDYGDDFYAYIIVNGNESWRHTVAIDSNVQLADRNDSFDPKQIWHFVRQSDNSYKIWNAYDGYALDADDSVTTGGANVQTWWESHDRDNQRWYIVAVSLTGVSLVSKLTQMAIDCTDGSITAGTNIQMWPINGTAAQSFSVYDMKNDKVEYNKPGKPSKVRVSVTGEKETGKTVTIQWTEAPLIGQFDKRTYNVEIYKDGSLLGGKSKTGLTVRDLQLPVEIGKYSVKVRSVNTRYKDWCTDSDTLEFTVGKAAPKLTFTSSNVSKKTTDAPFTNSLIKTTDGTVTFTSSNEKVATVNKSSGLVTIAGEGTTTITATAAEGKSYKAGSAKYTLTVTDGRTNISGCTVTLSPASYTYDGIAKEPTVTVKNGSTSLKLNTDYVLSYMNNTNAGTATVKLTGKGNYSGSVSKTFTISAASITAATVTGISNKAYTGSAQTQNPAVKVGNKTLTNGTDYTVAYTNNTNAGTATVKITGKGNYSGTVSKTFTISAVSIAGATVTGISNKTYTGSVQTQNPAVKVGNKTLTNGTDYTVVYTNNTNAGTATVKITGKGNYSGTVSKTFTISAASIAGATVTGVSNKTYTGSVQTQNPAVKVGNKTLTNGTDYTVVYTNNTNAGTATVKITGKGNYSGSVSKMFTISQASPVLTFDSANVSKTTLDATFTNALAKMTDGTITFKSNDTSVATVDSASGLITIKGIGTATITASAAAGKNYKAGSASYTLNVVDGRINISTCTITLSKTSYAYSGSARKPAVTVKSGSTTLTSGTDYIVSYSNNTNVGTGKVTATGKGKYIGSISKTFTISKASPKLTFESTNVSKTTLDAAFTNELTKKTDGTVTFKSSDTGVATVDSASGLITIKGIGTATIIASAAAGKNYKAGSASYTLNVVDGRINISTCTITLSKTSYAYSGSARKPAVTVKNGSTTLASGTDYTVSYSNNTNAGTGKVTVTGKGKYSGSISKTFTISKAAPNLTFESANVSKTTLDAAFTNELTKKTDGTVTFKSSDTGVATVDSDSGLVTIKGTGTTTITATAAAGKNYKAGSADYTLTVVDGKINISTCTVTLSKTSYTYSGSARKPAVTVKDGSATLVSGTDYTVSYKNNTNAGTATVTVTGKGSYSGTKKKTFTIRKAAPVLTFAEKSVSRSTLDEGFTNELTKKTDGAVTFTSNDTEIASVDGTSGLVTIKGAGTTVITASAAEGKNYIAGIASYALTVTSVSIEKASVAGVSLSYGYSGKAYTPKLTVKVNGKTLIKDTDFTVVYEDNKDPGTATITITGTGNYTGTRIKTFEIVDCVSSLVSGRTYQIIPKNNSSTAVCSYSGRMLNNTKVYITDRSSSEAMRFKAVKAADGTWKFINAKCELALAVQENSPEAGKGLILYDQSTGKAQNWKLSRKSDNSFAITNAVSGLYVSMSDMSAPKGTLLSMHENSGRGDQRFYIVETSAVDASFDGTYAVKASMNRTYGLNIASFSKTDGANVELYTYSNTNAKKFKAIYSGAGYYRLVNLNSGLVLSVAGNTKKDGTNVIQSTWKAQSGQRWMITESPDGTVTLKNALGTVLHLNGNKAANGTNVVAKNASATDAQKWYFE